MHNNTNISAHQQHVMDMTMYTVCMDCIQRGEDADFHRDILNMRAEDIKNKVQQAIADAINMEGAIASTLDEDAYREIIHRGFDSLTPVEKNILNSCSSQHESHGNLPWYEWDVQRYVYSFVLTPLHAEEEKKHKYVTIYLTQQLSKGEIYFGVDVQPEVVDKMGEIVKREKDMDYSLRGKDLLCKAIEELKAEGWTGWIDESDNIKANILRNLRNSQKSLDTQSRKKY